MGAPEGSSSFLGGGRCLSGQWGGNGLLWRRLARAPEAVAGHPVGRPLTGSAEPARTVRRAPRRRRSRAGALPRRRFEHASLLQREEDALGHERQGGLVLTVHDGEHGVVAHLVRVRVRIRVGLGSGLGLGLGVRVGG